MIQHAYKDITSDPAQESVIGSEYTSSEVTELKRF